MIAVRSLLVAVGVALSCLATALLVASLPETVVPDDSLVVVTFFTVAFTVSVSVWMLAGIRRSDPATLPRVESVSGGERPGAEFDASFDRWPLGSLPRERREAIRDRLREAAVRTLARVDDRSPDAARERVRRGIWTEDPVAAELLGPGDETGVAALRRRVRFRRDVRRTVEAIEAVADEEEP